MLPGVVFLARARFAGLPYGWFWGKIKVLHGQQKQGPPCRRAYRIVSNNVSKAGRTLKGVAQGLSLRDRRYCIRYPFAADVVVLDMESGNRVEGTTSDISMGGGFVCTSKPFPSNTRVRITLTRKNQKVEALAVVRIVKPRIGMGVEFMDLETPYHDLLRRWVEQLNKAR